MPWPSPCPYGSNPASVITRRAIASTSRPLTPTAIASIASGLRRAHRVVSAAHVIGHVADEQRARHVGPIPVDGAAEVDEQDVAGLDASRRRAGRGASRRGRRRGRSAEGEPSAPLARKNASSSQATSCSVMPGWTNSTRCAKQASARAQARPMASTSSSVLIAAAAGRSRRPSRGARRRAQPRPAPTSRRASAPRPPCRAPRPRGARGSAAGPGRFRRSWGRPPTRVPRARPARCSASRPEDQPRLAGDEQRPGHVDSSSAMSRRPLK